MWNVIERDTYGGSVLIRSIWKLPLSDSNPVRWLRYNQIKQGNDGVGTSNKVWTFHI